MGLKKNHYASIQRRCNTFATMFIGYLVVGIFALRQFGVQASLLLTLEEATMDVIDPEYFDPKDTYTRLDGEGGDSVTTRLTIIKQLPETCDIFIPSRSTCDIHFLFDNLCVMSGKRHSYLKTKLISNTSYFNTSTIFNNLLSTSMACGAYVGHFTVFGLSMGEFIKPTGLDVDMELCDMIEQPLLGQFLRKLGLAGKSCPVEPGTYDGERFRFSPENLPDEYEENKYQSKFEIFLDEKPILCIRSIADVTNVYDR